MNANSIIIYIKKSLLSKRFLKFSLVGGSGVLVNMLCLYFLTDLFRVYYLISSIVAIEISILSNFLLNNIWTWNDRRKDSIFKRLMKYHITVGFTAIAANWLLLLLLTELGGMHYLLSNVIGISVGMLVNFVLNDLWTFAPHKVKTNHVHVNQQGEVE